MPLRHTPSVGPRTSDAARLQSGIASVCSAHPLVIEAALLQAKSAGTPVLIEATCNQVNHQGGYTGMTPSDFRRFVTGIAAKVELNTEQLILGGDHLGPNPWKHLPAEAAMQEADAMIAAYVAAGFTKLHLDASMGCAGEPVALLDIATAERAARLAAIAESSSRTSGFSAPLYVIGTEVPIPGGAMEALEQLQVTTPEAAVESVEVHRKAFVARGLSQAFERVIATVVQPGVEFGNENVVLYDRAAARTLSAALGQLPNMVFEAHSTDYQPLSALSALVADGFAILKVGPGLTFALREALYGLDHIAAVLDHLAPQETLKGAMEQLMTQQPGHWAKYCHGSSDAQRLQRHYSYSDRIRYYWPLPEAQAAVARLLARLENRAIPETLVSQHLGALYPAVASGSLVPAPRNLLLAHVGQVIQTYATASSGGA